MINFTGFNIDKAAKNFKNDKLASAVDNAISQCKKISTQPGGDIFEKTCKDAVFSQKTFDEAKNIVMQSILSPSPKESAVYIKDDAIIYLTTGDLDGVHIDDNMNKMLSSLRNRIALVHSHPTKVFGGAMPVSLADFMVLNSCPALRSVYAINADGEYSLLKKAGNRRPGFLKIITLEDLYWDEFRDYAQKLSCPVAQEFVETRSVLNKIGKSDAEKEALYEKFNLIVDDMADKGYGADFVHQFWQKHSMELGVQYETNFNNLC